MSAELPENLSDEVRQLGAVQGVYRPARLYVIGVTVLAVLMVVYAAIVVGLAGILLLKPPQQPRELRGAWILFGLALVLFLGGLVTLFIYWRRLRQRVLICPGGLVLWWPTGEIVIHWGELQAVRARITRVVRHGVVVGMKYKYTLRRRDGLQLKLTDFFANIEEAGNRAQQELDRRQG